MAFSFFASTTSPIMEYTNFKEDFIMEEKDTRIYERLMNGLYVIEFAKNLHRVQEEVQKDRLRKRSNNWLKLHGHSMRRRGF